MTQEYKNFIQILKENNIFPVMFANGDYEEELFKNYKIIEIHEEEYVDENHQIYEITNLNTQQIFNLKALDVWSNLDNPELGTSFDEYKEVEETEEVIIVKVWKEIE